MPRKVLCRSYHSRLIPDWKAHRLCSVELGIRKCRESNYPIEELLRQAFFFDVYSISENDGEFSGKGDIQLARLRWLLLPWLVIAFVDEGHIERIASLREMGDHLLDRLESHFVDRGEI